LTQTCARKSLIQPPSLLLPASRRPFLRRGLREDFSAGSQQQLLLPCLWLLQRRSFLGVRGRLSWRNLSDPALPQFPSPKRASVGLSTPQRDGSQRSLAEPLFAATTCHSVIGPATDINFRDAAITWASFYTLMSKANPKVMKRTKIRKTIQSVCDLFRVSFDAFFRDGDKATLERIQPR